MNHSLRVTGASIMYQAGVPEKLIRERMGHLSTDGVHHYEHTTMGQQHAVSLSCKRGLTYQKELSLQYSSWAIPVPVQPPAPVQTPAPQMSFSGCNVTIYSTPLPPPPALRQPSWIFALCFAEQDRNWVSGLCNRHINCLLLVELPLENHGFFAQADSMHTHTLCWHSILLKTVFSTPDLDPLHTHIATVHTWYRWDNSFPNQSGRAPWQARVEIRGGVTT